MPARRRPDPKTAALRQSGSANPRPAAVQDPLFLGTDFFDPRDLVQVKYEMLRRVHVEKETIRNAAAVFGFSRPSFYQAQESLKAEGLAGLLPRKRGPHGPHKLSPDVVKFLLESVESGAPMRAAGLAKLVKERFGIVVHRRTIERVLNTRKKKQS